MAIDTSPGALNGRIDALRAGWTGYQAAIRTRAVSYLRAFSPEFDPRLGEHDQWASQLEQRDTGHYRSSFNLTRPVVEMWASLEAADLPTIRWEEAFIPTPAPASDPLVDQASSDSYRAQKQIARQLSTMREQVLIRQARLAKLGRHYFRSVVRKNIYGLSWMKCYPDTRRQRFVVRSKIDPSTVYPVWSGWEDDELDAVLVAYRKSAQAANEQFGDEIVKLDRSGIAAQSSSWYNPTSAAVTDADRSFVWIEDYWLVDRTFVYSVDTTPDWAGPPVAGRVVNAIRANGKLAKVIEYPGWTRVPYYPFSNDNVRDHTGFSDAATMSAIQDTLNRMLSQQSDVIAGSSRPKFKFRGDADRQVDLGDEQVVSLDPDEDIEQIGVNLNVFPTQVHGSQLMDVLGRATGLPDVAWGRIVMSQNSARALATAWRAVATRMAPRTHDDSEALERLFNGMLDHMELYGWDGARDLYQGNRDFGLDFPNQEPRDQGEVVVTAINKLGAGAIDLAGAMEEMGEKSPDEMVERVKLDYEDVVLHPEKRQAQLLLERLQNQIQIEAQQAQMAIAQQTQQAAAAQASIEQQAAAARQAQVQAAQQAAPTLSEGQNAPATAPGAAANPAQGSYASTLVQGGQALNRLVARSPFTP